MLRWLLRSCLFAAVVCRGDPNLQDEDFIRVDSAGRFVDLHGRVRFFHGINVVYKEWPWLPRSDRFDVQNSVSREDMENLRSWGFNIVRLGVMWPGVEPGPGLLGLDYLAAADKLAKDLGEHGIHTLIDLHQDIGSRHFCGEGFPEFYVEELLKDPDSLLSKVNHFPFPLQYGPMAGNASGYPSLDDCLKTTFGMYYYTEKVGALWGHLFDSRSELRAGALRYWAAVATQFRGRPYVLGYELLNEPSGFCLNGTLASCLDLDVLSNNQLEDEYLVPLYRDMAKTIRAVDKTTPIFYEPFPTPKLSSDPWFSHVPLGNDDQQVLAYHIYCQPGRVGGLACAPTQDLFMGKMHDFRSKNPGVAGFMTEFGAIGEGRVEMQQVKRLLRLADDALQSWAYWSLKLFKDFTTQNGKESFYDPDGNVEEKKLRLLTRSYAQAVSGDPTRMFFDPDTARFELNFVASNQQDAPTVIYINEDIHYRFGFEATVVPERCFQVRRSEKNYLELAAAAQFPCGGTSINVTITAQRAPSSQEGPDSFII